MTTLRRISCFILSLCLFSACGLIGPEAQERTVRVRLLADPKLREQDPRWSETAAGLLRAASNYFEREFGIRFVAQKIAPWELEESSPFVVTLMKRLVQKYPLKDQNGSYDLIIGLTGEWVTFYFGGRGMVNRFGNCREGLGNYLVSAVTAPYRYTGPQAELPLDVVALIHEFGHIFGAEHVKHPSSIMNDDFDYRAEFDAKSREIVMKNKFCPFGK